MGVQSLDREDPLEKGMATHSSILAWRNPRDRRVWRGPWGHRVRYNRATQHMHTGSFLHVASPTPHCGTKPSQALSPQGAFYLVYNLDKSSSTSGLPRWLSW